MVAMKVSIVAMQINTIITTMLIVREVETAMGVELVQTTDNGKAIVTAI